MDLCIGLFIVCSQFKSVILVITCAQTRGSYDFTAESFETYSEFIEHTMHEHSSQTSVSIGFAIPGIAEFGFNYADSRYSKSVRKMRRASGKVRP